MFNLNLGGKNLGSFILIVGHYYHIPWSRLKGSWYALVRHKGWKVFWLVGFCLISAQAILIIKYFEYHTCPWHRTLGLQSKTYSDSWNHPKPFLITFSMPTGISGLFLCKIWLVLSLDKDMLKSPSFIVEA